MNFSEIKLVYHQFSEICQYFFFKLIGLSPCSIDAFKIIFGKRGIENSNYKCCFSHIGTFYNFLLIAVTVVYNIWFIFYSLPTQSDFARVKIFVVPLAAVSFLGIILVVLLYTVRGKLLINFIDRLRIVDRNLDTCADYDPEFDYTNDSIFFVNFVFASTLTIMLFFAPGELKTTIFASCPIFLTTWPLIHFTIFINMIKLRFEGINCTLSKLETSKSKLLRSRELVLDDLASMKRVYVEICKACDDITSFYGMPVLVVIMLVSIRLIRTSYSSIINLIMPEKFFIGIYIPLFFLMQTTFILIVLTTAVSNVMKQVCVY